MRFQNLVNVVSIENALLRQLNTFLVKKGKRHKIESILEDVFLKLKRKSLVNPWQIIFRAIKNVRPVVEVKPTRFAGSSYLIPVAISESDQLTYCIRWIVETARNRNEITISDRLVAEFLDASNNRGDSVRKRNMLHKTAESNQAFINFRR